MKCENCDACQNTSYEYQEYECVLGVEEQEFSDGSIGCMKRKKTIQKNLEEYGEAIAKQWDGLADFMLESMKKDEALQAAIESVIEKGWCLCRKNKDGSLYECNTHEIFKQHAWEIRSKYEEELEKAGGKDD